MKPGGRQHAGSATLRVKTVEEVSKVAKFFHGRQFPGARSPVAVSFANQNSHAPEPHKVPPPRWGNLQGGDEDVPLARKISFQKALLRSFLPPGLWATRENV